jgi:hypothetical protein
MANAISGRAANWVSSDFCTGVLWQTALRKDVDEICTAAQK